MTDAKANNGSHDRPAKPAARPRRRLSWRKKLLFAVLVFTLLLGIPEILVRIFAPEFNNLRYSSEVTGGKPIGARGADFGEFLAHEPKAPGEFRIIMLGDSVTWGFNLAVEETISAQTESKLRRLRPEHPWRCINFAGMGTTPSLTRERVIKELKTLPADAVVYQLNINDMAWDDAEGLAKVPDVHVSFLKGLVRDNFYGLRARYLRYSSLVSFLEYKTKLLMYASRKPIDPANPGAGRAAFTDSDAVRARWDEQFRCLAEFKAICDERRLGFRVYLFPTSEKLSGDPRDNPFNIDLKLCTVDPYKRFEAYCARYRLPGRPVFQEFKAQRDDMLAGRIPYDPLFFLAIGDSGHPNRRGAEIFADVIVKDVLDGRLNYRSADVATSSAP